MKELKLTTKKLFLWWFAWIGYHSCPFFPFFPFCYSLQWLDKYLVLKCCLCLLLINCYRNRCWCNICIHLFRSLSAILHSAKASWNVTVKENSKIKYHIVLAPLLNRVHICQTNIADIAIQFSYIYVFLDLLLLINVK